MPRSRLTRRRDPSVVAGSAGLRTEAGRRVLLLPARHAPRLLELDEEDVGRGVADVLAEVPLGREGCACTVVRWPGSSRYSRTRTRSFSKTTL